MVAVVDGYDQIAATRLREGPANDGREVRSFVTEAINRIRAAGADGAVTVRADWTRGSTAATVIERPDWLTTVS